MIVRFMGKWEGGGGGVLKNKIGGGWWKFVLRGDYGGRVGFF